MRLRTDDVGSYPIRNIGPVALPYPIGTPDGKYVVGHVVKIQEEGNAVRKIILATAQSDTHACEISLPQDPGQAGKVQAADMIAMLAGYGRPTLHGGTRRLTRDAEQQKYPEIAALVSVTVGREQFRNAEPRFYTAWVKTGKAQCEQMFSALPSNSDIARRCRHVSKVP